jgi:hypothetical protein
MMTDAYNMVATRFDDAACVSSGDENSVCSLHSDDPGEQQDNAAVANKERNDGKESRIAAKESKAVRYIRAFAIAVIVLSTLGVAFAVFYYMTNSENATFRYRFKSDSYKILESIGSTFDRSLGSVDSFCVNMVSTAKEANRTWPYVTVSDFAVKSSKILTLSKGVVFASYAYVSHQERTSWNRYLINNDGWVNETFDVQRKAFNKTYFGPLKGDWTQARDIWDNHGVAPEQEYYWPNWQSYPAIAAGYDIYNWDYEQYLDLSGKRMVETHKAAITSTFNLPDPNNPDEVAETELTAEWFRVYLPSGRDPYEPFVEVLYVRHLMWPRLSAYPGSPFADVCGQPLLNKTDEFRSRTRWTIKCLVSLVSLYIGVT